jgi:hypothetical protein
MKLKHLVLSFGVAAAFAGQAQAASVSITQSLSFPGSYTIASGPLNSTAGPYYYELVNGGANTYANVTLVDTTPAENRLQYAVYTDTNSAVGAASTGTLVSGGSYKDEPGSTYPFFTFLMASGQQYVLELARSTTDLANSTTNINTVPLPGALWLFGSALLGFLGVSSRRKI